MTTKRFAAVVAMACAVLAPAGCSEHRSDSRATPSSSTATVGPSPTSVQQLCASQAWPHAIPNVVGQLLYQAKDGALGCFDNLRARAEDGHDPLNRPARPEKTYRISAVTPAAGTPVGPHDLVTVDVAVVDAAQPAVLRPCDWVTAAEAAELMGGPVGADPVGDQPGSVDVACLYDKPQDVGDAVEIDLQIPGAFVVDATSEYALATAASRTTSVGGVGIKAACVSEPTTTPPSTTLVVLLGGERLLRVTQGFGSCATLQRFAQLAIPRITPR